MKMTQDTPAIAIKQKDLDLNGSALAGCLSLIKSPISTVLDIRYGLGGWAKIVCNKFSGCTIEGYEQDAATARKAWKDFGVDLHVEKFAKPRNTKPDLCLADFNLVTKLNRSLLDNLLAVMSAKYLVFTDVCASKLHLNYASYGLQRADLEAYWKSFAVRGYAYLGHRKEHHAASTAIYKRNNKPPLESSPSGG